MWVVGLSVLDTEGEKACKHIPFFEEGVKTLQAFFLHSILTIAHWCFVQMSYLNLFEGGLHF